MTDVSQSSTLEFDDNRLLPDLFGAFNRNLAEIEAAFGARIDQRGNALTLMGDDAARELAQKTLETLYDRLKAGRIVEIADVRAAVRMARGAPPAAPPGSDVVEIRTPRRSIEPRSPAQNAYARALGANALTFGVGPAGTGKTYLAVAAAVEAYSARRVDKIILSRPAVEAGERLGFLPGDMKDKVDPFLRPLYDSLNDMLPPGQVVRNIENGVFEVAPLAFMRGRTLSNAFVVLDEAQNCTEMQMKMFLTRLGDNAYMAVTGDPSQIDLPPGQNSGLTQALKLLEGVKGVGVTRFTGDDVVRHPLVARIVKAYDADSAQRRAAQERRRAEREAAAKALENQSHNAKPTETDANHA